MRGERGRDKIAGALPCPSNPTQPIRSLLAKVGLGEGRAVAAVTVEWLLGQETFAETHGNGRDAPKAAVHRRVFQL